MNQTKKNNFKPLQKSEQKKLISSESLHKETADSPDWVKIKNEYVSGKSRRNICKDHGVNYWTLHNRIEKGNWINQKKIRLTDEVEEKDDNVKKIINKLLDMALNGDIKAIDYMLTRIYGHTKSKTENDRFSIAIEKQDLLSDDFFNTIIRRIRESCNMTLAQFSDKIKNEYDFDISENMLGKIERGDSGLNARLFMICAYIQYELFTEISS